MASAALRWILDQKEITCIIPGFKNQKQVADNLEAIHTKPFSLEEMKMLENFYHEKVKEYIKGLY
jgi:aryl-alcohol dehydrogenase-like predicted oxidoreductase